jgi:glycosyltransferase involved in cell wall biosynthesis
MNNPRQTLGVLIRFSNSASTLPGVLLALKQQTLQPDVVLAVDSGSHDDSRALIHAAGGIIIDWPAKYEHSRVLNFGLSQLDTDLVLILSSHTVLEAPDTLERMVSAMEDPETACVSGKWDADSYYSDSIDWPELRTKGLKFGSIYSNSMGMIRRSLWQQLPFDEALATSEDYAWCIAQLKRGHRCRRLSFPFAYKRSGHVREAEFAHVTFHFARLHGLHVAWLGPVGSIKYCLWSLVNPGDTTGKNDWRPAAIRLRAWISQWLFPGHRPWAISRP